MAGRNLVIGAKILNIKLIHRVKFLKLRDYIEIKQNLMLTFEFILNNNQLSYVDEVLCVTYW